MCLFVGLLFDYEFSLCIFVVCWLVACGVLFGVRGIVVCRLYFIGWLIYVCCLSLVGSVCVV